MRKRCAGPAGGREPKAATPACATPPARGKLVFAGQCLACHTADGYRSMKRLMKGRDAASIGNVVAMLHDQEKESPYRSFMPPLAGTKEEVAALVGYLDSLANPAAATPANTSLAAAE
ncbi:MAG: c-type cytochrome [Candidatus Sumerlaeia bacterium]|nr:c-type cytochrome [Candidatus Sumerlaeia bacterium]